MAKGTTPTCCYAWSWRGLMFLGLRLGSQMQNSKQKCRPQRYACLKTEIVVLMLWICSASNRTFLYVEAAAWVDNFLVPGTALTLESPPGRRSKSSSSVTPPSAEQVVIFEHTSYGAGGLVLNRPTPIVLRDLNIPRFSNGVFGQHRLYFGCGILSPTTARSNNNKRSSSRNDQDDLAESKVAIGEMSPWFWIHDLPQIPGSFLLQGASEPLYMGGNVDIASERLTLQEDVNPKDHFKFFWKAKVWAPGALEDELERGVWKTIGPLSASQAFLL